MNSKLHQCTNCECTYEVEQGKTLFPCPMCWWPNRIAGKSHESKAKKNIRIRICEGFIDVKMSDAEFVKFQKNLNDPTMAEGYLIGDTFCLKKDKVLFAFEYDAPTFSLAPMQEFKRKRFFGFF